MAQLVYNNKLLKITGETLYFANYRRHLNLFKRTLLIIKTQKALENAE